MSQPGSSNSFSAGESYFRQSRRPLAALVFVLPLLLLYELGTWHFHLNEAANTERRIVAFTWIRQAFAHLGATGPLLAPAAVVAMLMGWHIWARHPWQVRLRVPVAMAGESALLCLPLVLLVGVVTGTHLLLSGGADFQRWAALAVLGIGAGVYEELIFRLLGFALLHALFVDVLRVRAATGLVLTLGLTSVAFALYHHIGGEEPFTWVALGFRTAAGVWLGLVFAWRGFGLAAGAHAAYDVLLVTLLAGSGRL